MTQSQWISAFASPAQQPIYIFVTANVNDYVNQPISEERLRRTLEVVEKNRKNDPALTATLYFSGAMSDALSQRNDQDHLLDLVQSSVKSGAVKPAYDGSDEPTSSHRPMLNFSAAKTAEDRWRVRAESARELLTQARDPLTGASQPGKSGGLKRMQEVFGPATVIRGVVLQSPNLWGPMNEVGGDGEIINLIHQLNSTAIVVGLAETDLGKGESQFRPWANTFSKVMSPVADTSPEVYWQEDVLRLSETSEMDLHTFRAEDGVDKLKAMVAGMDRSHIRILHIDLSNQRSYLKPSTPMQPRPIMPLTWAWQHPDNPMYPEDMRLPANIVAAHYAQQEEVVKYLTTQFLSENPGSRFVSSTDIKALSDQGWGYDLPVASLRASADEMLSNWGDKTTPPPFLKVDSHYVSLSDLFEVLSDALAQRSQTGKFPVSVRVGRVFGPILTAQPRPLAAGEVTAKSVADTCAKLLPALHDSSWSITPKNAIPSPVLVEGIEVTPAQFLRLMAEALVSPTPDAKLQIKPIEMFTGRVFTFYTRRPHTDLGASWTFKPAVLHTDSMAGAATGR